MAFKLYRQMKMDLPLDHVFEFFSNAENLELITPKELKFKILSERPIKMYVGAEIDYKLKLFGVRFNWQSVISVWNPPHEFVDEQVKGPYKLWHHSHRFREDGDGTIIEDEVDYDLRFWPIGLLAYPIVRFQLKRIFDYRRRMIEKHLGSGDVVGDSSVAEE